MLATYTRRAGWFHVVPTNDLIGHRTSGLSCVCGATARLECHAWVVVHQALDGRS